MWKMKNEKSQQNGDESQLGKLFNGKKRFFFYYSSDTLQKRSLTLSILSRCNKASS